MKAAKTIEYPADSGVLIREIPNVTNGQCFGSSYLVTIPRIVTGAGRKRKQFTDLGDAKEWAKKELGTGRELGRTFYDLTDHEKRLCLDALDLLKPKSISILKAAQFAVER